MSLSDIFELLGHAVLGALVAYFLHQAIIERMWHEKSFYRLVLATVALVVMALISRFFVGMDLIVFWALGIMIGTFVFFRQYPTYSLWRPAWAQFVAAIVVGGLFALFAVVPL